MNSTEGLIVIVALAVIFTVGMLAVAKMYHEMEYHGTAGQFECSDLPEELLGEVPCHDG